MSVFINKEEKREKRKRERGKEAGCLECQRRKSWGQEKKILLKRVQTDHYSKDKRGIQTVVTDEQTILTLTIQFFNSIELDERKRLLLHS